MDPSSSRLNPTMNPILRLYFYAYPPSAPKADVGVLRFGILGAAAIAPPALVLPALSHPETIVHAVAARDLGRAKAFAKKHGIPVAYGGPSGYQELIDDPEIDVIYNPLPNSLHYEWTMKALSAGKHVLLEKPAANTANETRAMFALAKKKNLVLLEAFHYRFHPSNIRLKAILDSGELGAIKSVETFLGAPKGMFAKDDIRYDYSLGGGALMDTGCYTVNALRHFTSNSTTHPTPTSISSAQAVPPASDNAKVDQSTTAHIFLPAPSSSGPSNPDASISASLICNTSHPLKYGIFPMFPTINFELEGGSVEMYNFVQPTMYHYITVRPKGEEARTEKAYTFGKGKGVKSEGEDWWSTYRYQLEVFVDRVKGRDSGTGTWVEEEDSVANMAWIEAIYEKVSFEL